MSRHHVYVQYKEAAYLSSVPTIPQHLGAKVKTVGKPLGQLAGRGADHQAVRAGYAL
jgi:hypothetical protein